MKKTGLLCVLVLALCLALTAAAEEATPTDLVPVTGEEIMAAVARNAELPPCEDITHDCTYNGYEIKYLHDGSYMTFWEGSFRGDGRTLEIAAPEGQVIGGVLLKWRLPPIALYMQARNEQGEWENIASFDGKFYAQYYPVDGLKEIRFLPRDNPRAEFKLSEVTVVTPGKLPDSFQVWEEPSDHVDMMLVHGHPDDELLWFGGLLPYYGGELDKEVLVVCVCPAGFHRKLELLDGLWTCGLRVHPILGTFHDYITNRRDEILQEWGDVNLISFITEQMRTYHPKVMVTQDEKGEYGHGVHRAVCYAVKKAVEISRDPEQYPKQAGRLGVWDVQKVYIHLYEENQITMDWQVPLERFDGMIAQDVTRKAFLCHRSQQGRGWAVNDGGVHDNSLFGLYYTTVGPDEKGGDMFEHIE